MTFFLGICSFFFNFLTSLRNFLYNINVFSSKSISVPVISVGNLELGGTGKTPLVMYISLLLLQKGFKPGIISRGYRRSSVGRRVVSDGLNVLLSLSDSGDEAFLLAKSLKNIPIIVDKNRVAAAAFMVSRFNVNIIILDDGFQHRKINRNIDIVLLNANTASDQLKLFPLGFLRENINNINRADILLITKQLGRASLEKISFYNNLFDKYQFFSSSEFSFVNAENSLILNPDNIAGNVFVFCGIGDSNYFKKTIISFNVNITIFKSYKDHHDYDELTLNDMHNIILNNNIQTIITTEKDFIKLPKAFYTNLLIVVLKMRLVINKDFDELIIKMLKQV